MTPLDLTPLDLAAPGRLYDDRRVGALLAALSAPDEETRIVGGAVRNALLGRPVHEVDLATTLPPDRIIRQASAAGLKAIGTGLAHGTVTVLVAGTSFEVTTLREDVETDGRHARVRFGRDFVADALRRDFTMNALSVSPGGRLHDAAGGLPDLAARRVRFIGDARARIREDYLRTLRLFRFHAEYGEGELDRNGLDAAIRERDGLSRLSRERIGAEMRKLLAARRAAPVLALMGEAGFVARLLGGPAYPGRLARATAAGRNGTGRLAAALVLVREDAERLRDRLRLSNAEHERLLAYAAAVARLRSPARTDEADLRRAAFLGGTEAVLDAAAALAGEARPHLTGGAAMLLERYRTGEEKAPAFPLTARELVERGIPPGPALGHALREARDAWLAAGCPPSWSAAGR